MKTIVFAAPGAFDFSFSDDWRYLDLEADSTGLVVTDLQTGATSVVATAPGTTQGGDIIGSVISPDGQFVAYNTLVFAGTDTFNTTQTDTIKVFDRVTGDTRTVFSDTAPQSNSLFGWTTFAAAISPDDQSLFFTTDYLDATGGDNTDTPVDLFELNLQTNSMQKVLVGLTSFSVRPSTGSGGQYIVAEAGDATIGYTWYRVDTTNGNVDALFPGNNNDDTEVSLSADARFAVITTTEALLPGDTNGVNDIYLEDLSTGALRLISASPSGAAGNGDSYLGTISSDDSRIVFETKASNVSPGATNADPHIVSMDLATGAIGLLWDNSTGGVYKVSADGETLALETSDHLTPAGSAYQQGIYLIHFTPPKLTIDPVSGDKFVNAADGAFITVSGESDAIGQSVTLTLSGSGLQSTALVKSDGSWIASLLAGNVTDGAYNVHAIVTDGLTTTADESITVDRTPPQFTVTSVAGDDIINLAESTHASVIGSVLVANPTGPGTLSGPITISVDNGPSQAFYTAPGNPTAVAADNFSHNFDASGLADGQHTITFTATDEAGNTTSVTKDVLVDKTPPKISITSVSGDDVVDSSEIKTAQGVHGTSDAIGQTVNVLIDGVQAGHAVVQADGTWLSTVDFSGTVTGNHDITAEVSDEAGNPGRADAGVYVDTGFAVTQLSDGPDGEQGGGQGVMFPGLSADGTKLVFTGLNFDLMSNATGSSGAQVYIKDLTTGAITFATPDPSDNAEFGAISPDGRYVEFVTDANLDPINQSYAPGLYFTYTKDLTTGTTYFHSSSDDGYDGTNPDTFNPGITAAYYDLGEYPDGAPIAPLPVFPLAIADGGSSLELIDDLEPVQVVQPLVMTTQIRLDSQFLDSNNTPYFSSGAYAQPDATPPIENAFGRFIVQEFAPQLSADGSVMAFEARFFPEQWDTSNPAMPSITVGAPTVTEIYAGQSPPTDEEGNDPIQALASSFSDGTPMPFGAIDPALSADGKFVAFWSWGTDDKPEVFVKNLTTGELKIASSDALGNAGVNNASGTFNAGFNSIAISADGRYVAFTSDANLTPDDSGTGADLYVKDMQTGAIERVPLPAGTFATDLSTQLTMTANGQYIAFTTSAGLSAMDVNHTTDIYGISLTALGTPPTISLDAVAGDDRIDASENSKNLTVSGASDAIGGNVALVIDGNTFSNVVVGDNGTWSTTIDTTQLIDGAHQFRATVTNAAGATGSVGDLVTVDTTAPTVVLSSDTTHFAVGQPVTVTATFSEAVHLGGAQYFEVGTDVTVTNEGFINDHTYAATFTPDSGLAFLAGFEVVINPGQVTDAAGNDNTDFVELTIGRSFDGYIVGGTVRYANGSGNGASATTGADGGFSLSGGNGPLVMTGGTDSATGLAFTGVFYAPDGASVVSPLTTLIEKVIEAQPADSVAQANALVASALGLPTGIDLTSLDAVAGALSGDASSTAAFKEGSELLDVLTLIQAAGGSSESAYWALVGEITAGTRVDLTDAATINAIGQSAGLGPVAAQAVASIASATGAALEQQLAGATTPFDVVVDITGASIAEQGDAANALSHASGDAGYQQVADSYVQNLAATLSHDDLTAADNVACYCRGTLIETGRGETPVERLAIGDRVVTASGLLRPIKWIGTRSYGGRFILGRTDILPICFKAGSLGDNVPKRDLWISPHHAMYLDGVLIEARDLVNGVSIVQAERVEKVEYFHIELDSHDVILAEGALSETFVDDDSRGMFHNAHEYGALYPGTERVVARYCAKRCAEGYEVEAARRDIDARAGLRRASGEAPAALRGYVDAVRAGYIAGWAQNPDHPEAPVCLDIFVGGRLIGQTLANRFRDDLAQAGLGSGRHGFEFIPPPGFAFAASTIEVRRSIDGARLALSSGAEQVRGSVRRKSA